MKKLVSKRACVQTSVICDTTLNKSEFDSYLQRCRKMGGELMEPRSPAQTQMISPLMQSDTHYWIGLTDFVEEGTFRWNSDDSLVSYTNWYKSEPNNQQPDGEDCVITSGTKIHNTWNDQSCSRRMGAYGGGEFYTISAPCQKQRP